jgi:hypothetical protein
MRIFRPGEFKQEMHLSGEMQLLYHAIYGRIPEMNDKQVMLQV